jgi:hypothetical protein
MKSFGTSFRPNPSTLLARFIPFTRHDVSKPRFTSTSARFTQNSKQRIHFLGLNSTSVFIAGCLSLNHRPRAATIITHDAHAYDNYKNAGRKCVSIGLRRFENPTNRKKGIRLNLDGTLRSIERVEIQYVPVAKSEEGVPEQTCATDECEPIGNLIWTSTRATWDSPSLSPIEAD